MKHDSLPPQLLPTFLSLCLPSLQRPFFQRPFIRWSFLKIIGLMIFSFLAFFSISAKSPNVTMTSETAQMDQNALFLQKNVHFQHDLGEIWAKEAFFENFPSKRIYLEEVYIQLTHGGSLHCDKGTIDSTKKQAFFSSKDKLTYQDTFSKEQKCFSISSKELEISFEDDPLEKLPILISSLQFTKDVEVKCPKEFYFKAQNFIYNCTKEGKKILFFPPQENHLCVCKIQKNVIKAKKSTFDLQTKDLILEEAQGAFYHKKSLIEFSSHRFMYNILSKNFLLDGSVYIKHPVLGFLSTEQFQWGKNSYMQTSGATQIQLDNSFSLKCSGQVSWEKTPHLLKVYSKNEPLIYYNKDFTIYANRASIAYQTKNNHFSIEKICLEDEIRFVFQKNQEKSHLATADQVIFIPETSSFTFSASTGKKVLFSCLENSLKLSASQIKIHSNLQETSPEIQGIGDVRFFFDLKEEKSFQELFKYFKNYDRNLPTP